jgi:hypothetical protein
MSSQKKRVVAAAVLAVAALGIGYVLGGNGASAAPAPAAATVSAPPAGSVRVLYSLDAKQNDQQLSALIDAAKTHAYFAVYEFTLKDVADALVRAKQRGLDVRGLVDSTESASSYDQPIIQELVSAGIPVETEKHADANGIMHIKLLVTDSAYAMGSYNWTGSATTENDEILEIGTDSALVQTYEQLLLRLFTKYRGTNAAAAAAAPVLHGPYAMNEASSHVGEYAEVTGTLIDAYVSASGTVFLDFCKNYKSCPFSGVIFADDAKAFGDLSRYAGHTITLTGTITSYQGTAEIKLTSPGQLSAS